MEIKPGFVLVGSQHIKPDEETITEVRFKLSDTQSYFSNHRLFGTIFNAPDDLQKILDARRHESKITAGSGSIVSYFSGDYKIVEISTNIGMFAAFYDFSSSPGRAFSHDISLSLKFENKVDFEACLERVLTVRRFVTMAVGEPQLILGIDIVVDRIVPTENFRTDTLQVHWSGAPRGFNSRSNNSFHDAPVHPVRDKESFSTVMQNWLARENSWFLPRRRYVECVEDENHYSANRLVAAANMFDILPSEALPTTVQLPAGFSEALDKAKALFDEFPRTDLCNSVRGNLSRAKKPALKAKIYHRSAIVCSLMSFPQLNEVIRIAVDFRNFFVHGSDTFDYGKYEIHLPFLTEALEFTFAASDFIDAGWDAGKWYELKIWGSHKFTSFRRQYPENIAFFTKALASPRVTPKR